MSDKQIEFWKGEVIVQPKLEWEELGIASFRIGRHEEVTLQEQLDDKTRLSVTVCATGEEVYRRTELLTKSFLAALELEAKRNYEFLIGNMIPAQPKTTENGWTLLAMVTTGTIKVHHKLGDLELRLFRILEKSLKMLDKEKIDRILVALEYLHSGLAAYSAEQSFLSIYGGLNYLVGDIAKGKSGGKTTRKEDVAVIRLTKEGVLNLAEAEDWIERFEDFHDAHYKVLYGSQDFKREELDKKLNQVRMFFSAFLLKYVEYLEAQAKAKPTT